MFPSQSRKMQDSSSPIGETVSRCFGVRIEHHVLQVAVATSTPSGRFHITLDEVACPHAGGWLSGDGSADLIAALETMVDRHQMRRQPIAVSLDGDYCVTRVTIGTHDHVDQELERLADRIPRYLQLGPGEKVTGSARHKIDATTDYAVNGVVNRSIIAMLYDAFRKADVEVMWIEPSLVGLARLVGQSPILGNQPVLIADGTGRQWVVGIAYAGRLLLDYRPATATSASGLRRALDGHITRLKRFCHRHAHATASELNQMLICGDSDKPDQAVELLGDGFGLAPTVLSVPDLPDLYTIDDAGRRSRFVPVVATVLPLLIRTPADQIPDLLSQVRRAPDISLRQKLVREYWPVAVACAVLLISYVLVSGERQRHADSHMDRDRLQSEIVASNVKFGDLGRRREYLGYFQRIRVQTTEPDWVAMLTDVTGCLPPTAKLNDIRLGSDGAILMDGTVMDASTVYELVNTLRQMPGVTQVALKGTTPQQDTQATRFVIRLATERAAEPIDPDQSGY